MIESVPRGVGRRDDAAVPVRLVELDGEQGQTLRSRRRDQAAQGLALDQRHVAVEDERRAAVVEARRRLLQGVAGAELRLLANEDEAGRLRISLDLVGAVAGDDDRPGFPQRSGGVENMLQ